MYFNAFHPLTLDNYCVRGREDECWTTTKKHTKFNYEKKPTIFMSCWLVLASSQRPSLSFCVCGVRVFRFTLRKHILHHRRVTLLSCRRDGPVRRRRRRRHNRNVERQRRHGEVHVWVSRIYVLSILLSSHSAFCGGFMIMTIFIWHMAEAAPRAQSLTRKTGMATRNIKV